ncbi:DDT domain-containing protein DDR4 [Cajanus cajan]|uniref:Remodeling and spacing factor 1 n=1 Tax=Cajanus cajan TaxID=3821 RepID=A0A151SQU5_CAJCA|nr:DDT domain-containing protein DDR4 [Cajanus cajan]KYP57206.1 Remodeling and spacing factor 1 [Cajanus cajan]
MQAAEDAEGRNARFEENDLDLEISRLRGRWELASVLNFLDVFGPILGKDLKLSAEDIEIGLVKPDASLARLHIQILKGMPPVSKTLEESDKWVTSLCKKLTMWWPWVAEGEIPLVPSKGEEISKYKELNPSDRLLLLRALCEVRADQHDAVSYINDALKEGTQISSFRKDALGRDGTGTSYWYDATSKGQSHRLYREIITSDSIPKDKDERRLSLPTIQWETLASNLEDFSKVAENFTFSKSSVEVAVSMKLQSDAIPTLEKIRKKKERAMKQKQRQDKLLKDVQISHCSGNTRSCRTRRPINYTFEAYDRTMEEAIQLTNKRKKSPVADQDKTRGSEDKSNSKDVSTDGDSERDVFPVSDSEDDTGYKVENHGSSDEDGVDGEMGNSEAHSSHAVSYPKGVRCSKRLAGVASHTILESRGLTTKQRLRQRPTRNSAIESVIVSDSEDEACEGKTDLSESN